MDHMSRAQRTLAAVAIAVTGPLAPMHGAQLPAPIPTKVTVTGEIDARHYQTGGVGDCLATRNASSFGVPETLWRMSLTSPAAAISRLNVAVWTPKADGAPQVHLVVNVNAASYEIVTVAGEPAKGSATVSMEPKGRGGVITIDGRTSSGATVRLQIGCEVFAVPESG
jgi:hypothetical protein